MFTRRQFVAAGAGAATIPLASGAFAQSDYPAGPLRAICMFPPGTGADVLVRFYANKLSQLSQRTVIVENKPGAFGNIATEYVARAKPDGLTIYIAPGSSVLAAAPHLFKKLSFDPINDFEHVTTLSKLAFILCVPASKPWKTVADLTAYLKEQGDKASYGSVANTGLVSSEIYKAQFGLKAVEVKYKEATAMYNDLINEQLAFFHIDPVGIKGLIDQGKVRPLALGAAERMKALPDIPGAREAGIPNSNLIAWWSVHMPAKTPKPLLDKLEVWFNQIAIDPETVKFLSNIGTDPFPGNSTMLKELLLADTKAWGDYVKLAKIDLLG
ncbi:MULTISPECIES: tripartite tricarboxylate transporter substrate binding protein [unclassified Beijerinckia]|uniref:Bug family tripartite tricarboxylate transporter substrate binding protein n=1 Tax=unclassified Beijerinckia TaxID=2638183 RepID=UPI000894DFA5|nr:MULTISPECIES: tripartite tricarboxylate transporter substrate binding protein [unclassified Beijerinckia]MDH7799422.1 tripartite-type tricarboxylate transporter receptor subunit TctC [Beijerinckia sp. GAS462]SED49870.1 Tripartite-type tricarboxylate transporter, receptor component TctC [Beijerinckia sp. 28-YEA-48]